MTFAFNLIRLACAVCAFASALLVIDLLPVEDITLWLLRPFAWAWRKMQ